MVFPLDVDATWVNPSSVQLNGGELRRADSAMFAGEGAALGVHGGVVRHGNNSLAVTVDGSDVVTVQPGAVVIPGNAVQGTGCYRFGLAVAASGSLTVRTTSPRIDLVVARQLDTDIVGSHGAYTGRFEVIPGTPSATPGVPSLPSMAVELCRVNVPATGGGQASVDSSFRTYAAAVGGEIPVPTAQRLPTSAATGQRAIALDTLVAYRFDGTSWVATKRVETGSQPITPSAPNVQTAVTITFERPFSAPPDVIVGYNTPLADGASPYTVDAWATTITATSFRATVRRSNTTPMNVTWIAGGI